MSSADDPLKEMNDLASRLLARAAGDGLIRDGLRSLAIRILYTTETPATTPSPPAPPPPVVEPVAPQRAEPRKELTLGKPRPARVSQELVLGRTRPAEALKELTLGRSRPNPPKIEYPSVAAIGGEDLEDLANRCLRKAEAARGLAARLRPGQQRPPAPGDPEIAAWADRVADAYFWKNSPGNSRTIDVAMVNDLGGSFEALAVALDLVLDAGDPASRKGRLEPTLHLAAEAQSSVRAASQSLGLGDDVEQVRAFEWLKATASRQRVFIPRHMRVDDPADPSGWPDLLARIATAAGRDRPNPRDSRLDPIRTLARRLRGGQPTTDDCRELAEAVDQAVSHGLPPSDREVRDLLLPLIDELPDRDDPPNGFRLVLREIDRYLAIRTPPSTPNGTTAEPSAEVKAARRLLGGRSVVLIGGARRRDAERLLTAALGLKELVWVETREHQSISAFEPAVARADVALVVLAIRWSSHAFGDVKLFCDRHGKPLVRLPGGYNPNQVASQILAQCSDQLTGGDG